MERFWNRRRLAALGVLMALLLAGAGAMGGYVLIHSGVSAAAESIDRVGDDADYTLEITPYMDAGALYVEQTIAFVNGDEPLDRLVMSLPVNAYRRAVTAPMDGDSFDAAFAESYAPGGIDFERITVNGEAVEWGASGGAEALLTLLCSVDEGQRVTIDMTYHAVLPEFEGAGGIGDGEWRLNGFCPQLARLDDGEWTAYAPTYIGQYACAPVSDFDVTLHAPQDWDVIAVGAAQQQADEEGWSTWRIRAHDVRDMGIVLRRGGCVYERDMSGVKVRVYGASRLQARRLVDVAATAVERMSAIYPYPYPVLSIVTGGYAGRDESMSGLIVMDGGAEDAEAQLLYLIARQWWGGLVGVEPIKETWLSEALAQYTALTCARDAGLGCYGDMRQSVDAALGITLPGGLTVDSGADAFSAQTDYDNVLRYRGAAVLELLDEVNGGMAQALAAYAQDNAFGYGDRESFAAALGSVDGGDWSAWLDETLQGIGKRG